MKTLWFKQCYVAPILSGKKTDTIRKNSSKLPNAGDIVALSVGPRPPFAQVRIIKRETIDPAALPEKRRKEVLGIYRDHKGFMVRLRFDIVSRY